MKDRKYWIKEADRLMSLLVRQSNAKEYGVVRCFTCNKPLNWRDMHNGHYMTRNNFSTRYLLDNTEPQCAGCNTYRNGEQAMFRINLVNKLGLERVEEIENLSKSLVKLSLDDIKQIALDFKAELIRNEYEIR